MRQINQSQSGFSLVELLVAVMILAVGLLGLAELQITTIKANAQTDSITVAAHLAQKVVEEISAAPNNDPRLVATGATRTWTGSPFDIVGAGVYNVTYDVVSNHGGVTGLSQVTVYVASAGQVMNVLGKQQRLVNLTILKRTI